MVLFSKVVNKMIVDLLDILLNILCAGNYSFNTI